MKNVSNDFKIISKKVKHQDVKLTINDGELTVQEVHLMSVKLFNAMPISRLRARQQVIAKDIIYSFEGQLFKSIMQQIEITVKNASKIKDKNVNFKYGLLIKGNYEYVDMGDFYIKDVEDDKNKEELSVTGYDKMLNFMVPFKQSELKLSYPCTVAKLLNKMCEIRGVELYSSTFYNSNLIINEDFFTVQEITYRDVLDKIAQATLTTPFIKENKLYMSKVSNTSVQTLDTSYLSNLVINEKFGPVNALVLGRGVVEDNIESTNQTSINTNGRCEIRFDENEILDDKRSDVVDDMLKQIEGLEYYSIEASNLGLIWLEPCDMITTKDREGSEYKSIYLKARIKINTGISGEMESNIPEESNTKYRVSSKEEKKTLRVERLAKKHEGIIQDIIEEQTETSNKVSEHTQTIDTISEKVGKVEKKAATKVDIYYAISDSSTKVPTTGWSTTAPTWQNGKFMWQKVKSTYANGDELWSDPICISGAKGEQGIQGPKGSDGKTTYFHIKYSSVANPTSSSQMSETPNTYIGTYVDFTEADSTDPKQYTWTQFKGAKGEQGIKGTNGINGVSYYLHIKYSNDGKTFTANNGETVGEYIGTLTDTKINDSTIFSDYKWAKIKGKGIKSLEEQYYLSTSINEPVGGTWKTTQDKVTTGKYLWTRTKITYDDNTTEYTKEIPSVAINEVYAETIKTAEGLKDTVKKGDLGTAIEQNFEHVKIAWNKISEFIQMELINKVPSLAFRKDANNLLMALDKLGQHFYKIDGKTVFGDMGVQNVDSKNYISFSVTGDYNSEIQDGMAWGMKTASDNKFFPILFIKNFTMGAKNSGACSGQLVLNACDLLLEGLNTGIISGNIKIVGDIFNNIQFIDTQSNNVLLNIYPANSVWDGQENGAIDILDDIHFRSQGGIKVFYVGNDIYLSADGSARCKYLQVWDNIFVDKYIDVNGYINATAFNNTSLLKTKKNIKEYRKSALKEVMNTHIYSFNYKKDKKGTKKTLGAVIGDGYDCSSEILSNDGKAINQYSMTALAYKAIQEQQDLIEKQQKQIEENNKIINDLITRVEALEKGENK